MDPTFATILGALLGALLTGPIAYYFTKKLLHLQEFNKAAILFRNSFVDEIDFLKYHGDSEHWIDDTAYGVIVEAYSKHRKAYESFRLDLPIKKRVAFDKAWEKYLYPEGDPENYPEHVSVVGNQFIKGNSFTGNNASISLRTLASGSRIYVQDNDCSDYTSGNCLNKNDSLVASPPVWPDGLKARPVNTVIDWVIENAGCTFRKEIR